MSSQLYFAPDDGLAAELMIFTEIMRSRIHRFFLKAILKGIRVSLLPHFDKSDVKDIVSHKVLDQITVHLQAIISVASRFSNLVLTLKNFIYMSKYNNLVML